MAGVFEPESSNVTVSPVLNTVRLVPYSQLTLVPTSQMLAVPSPRQTKSCGGGIAEITSPTVLVMRVPSLPATTKLKLPRPMKLVGVENCAVWPSGSNVMAPLIALDTV